jgi:arylsulfatase A-like enzyme
MGRLLAGLEERGLMEKTVVLVASDHGEELWEHQEQERARGYEPVADHGHSLYRELVRVPGLLWVPGGSPAVVEEPAELADFAPTLLALLGVEPPPYPGRDLLSGPVAGALEEGPPWVGGFLLYGPERAAVRRGPWKLVVPVGGGGGSELYDLEGDPGEHRDLAAERPERAAELRGLLQRVLAERRQLGRRLGLEPSRPAQLDPERQESLRALGYVD